MKKKSLVFSSLFMVAALMSAVVFYSCSKDEAKQAEQVEQDIAKTLVIYDSEGVNSVTVRVSSTDPSVVSAYSEENFELLINPDFANEDVDDSEEEYVEDGVDEDDGETLFSVTFFVIEKNFSENVITFSLVENQPEEFNDLRGFSNKYFVSDWKKWYVKRSSFWYSVQMNAKYCIGEGCGTQAYHILNDWLWVGSCQISNGETETFHCCGLYARWFGGYVRAKNHNKTYSHWFENPNCEGSGSLSL